MAVRSVLDERLDPDHVEETVARARLDLHASIAVEFGRTPHPETAAWVVRAEGLARSAPAALRDRALVRLVAWYGKASRLDEAQATWEMTRDQLDTPTAINMALHLAAAYQAHGDLDRAIPLYEQTLADSERVLGPDHPLTVTVRRNLEQARRVAAGEITG